MPRHSSGDEGATHVLEAVIIASIMLSAVAFVATFENPVSGSTPTRDALSKKAEDALALLLDTPVKGSDYGDNLLSVLLAQCMQGDCDDLTAKLDKLLPAGASYALYVSNGYDTYPVHVTRQPAGEAVTSKVLLEPHWSYVFTSTGLTVVNNQTDPQLTYALPVYNANVVSPGGSPIKVIVRGVKQSDGSAYTLEAFYTTEVVDATQAGQTPAVSLNFLANRTGIAVSDTLGTHLPSAFWMRSGEVLGPTGHPNNASVTFRIALNESAGAPVPAGTHITVNVPRGWNATGWSDANWLVLENATDRNASVTGSDVVAKLLRPVQGGTVEFRFNATYHGDLLRYYPFRAVLTRGATAEANLIVEADQWPENTQTFAIPRVVASVPRPMGATAETTWSLAVNIPYNPAGGYVVSKSSLMKPNIPTTTPQSIVSTGGQGSVLPRLRASETAGQVTNILVQSIELVEQDGAPIFAGLTPGRVGQGKGEWTVHPDRLVWEGLHSTTTGGTLALTFNVTASGKAGSPAPKSMLLPPIAYETFEGRLLQQTAPGLYRDAFLPNNTTASYYDSYSHRYKGYDPTASNATSPLSHAYASTPTWRGTLLEGNATYVVHPVSPFTDALYGSYVAVEKRKVPVGGQVVLTADVQSMLYALSAAGQSAGVNLTFYPPWSGNSKVPIWSQNNLDSAFLTSDVVQLVMLDMNGDGFPDPVVGTNQGRVLGFDGITGQRLQGNTWIAPVLGGQTGAAAIRHLSLITLGGQDYVVAATDGKSGVYVIDKGFNEAWAWSKTADTATLATVALDTSADVDGDGRRDVSVALENGAVYVLRALAGNDELQPLAPATPPPAPFAAFNKSQGTPSAILSLPSVGQSGTPGVAVSLVSIPAADLNVRLDRDHPEQTSANPQLNVKTPRAGLTVFDNVGATAWTFLNSPVSAMRAYDHNGDARTDILVGASSGHVVMLNGERGAAPLSSVLWTPVQGIIDGDSRDLAHSVILTEDGTISFTYDGWSTHNCVACDPLLNALGAQFPTMNGVALNSTMGIWAAGDNSMMLRATPGLAPGYPGMSLVVPNATKAGAPYNFNLSLHRFNDVHFDWGAQGDNGWAVGSPLPSALCLPLIVNVALTGHCDEGLLMRTTNGGQSWTILTALDGTMNATAGASAKVMANLTRVNFTTDSVGWVVGESGTLLRTLDGGASFRQLSLPTTVHLRDVSCAPHQPDVCVVVGAAGVALRSTDATSAGPTWTNISALLPSGGQALYAVGLVSADEAFVGLQNRILHTLDAGQHWTELPMGYVQSSAYRMNVFPEGSGYIFGGNATSGRQWWLHDFARSATARTTDVTASLPLPADAKVYHASAWVAATPATGTSANVYLSANGGATWNTTVVTMTGQTSSVENTVPVALATDKHSVNFTDGAALQACATCGRDVRFRIDLATTPDVSMQSMFVADLTVEVQWVNATGIHNRTYAVDLSTTTLRDPATTATWNADVRAIHLPVVQGAFWATNVSGGVLDLQTGWNAVGDARKDVWVATGDVVAENSPDYAVYAGTNVSRLMGSDNRVYLLDGQTGAIVASTPRLPGNVKQLRLADLDGDTVVDAVFANVAQNGTAAPMVKGFDAVTLAPLPDAALPDGWTYTMPMNVHVNDMELGLNATGDVALFLARASYTTTAVPPSLKGGAVEQVDTDDARASRWFSPADERGIYVVEKEIPRNWFFGPYVVEVKVDWQDSVDVTEGGATVTKTIVQSAQFYDYFLVTPPDALNPPHPIYTVHLVTWLDDWR